MWGGRRSVGVGRWGGALGFVRLRARICPSNGVLTAAPPLCRAVDEGYIADVNIKTKRKGINR